MTLTKTCVLAVSRTYVKLTERSSCNPATSSRPNGGCVVCLLGIPSHWVLTIALRNGHTSSYPSRPGIPIFLTHWVELLFGLDFWGSNWIRILFETRTASTKPAVPAVPCPFCRRRLFNAAYVFRFVRLILLCLCLKLLSNPTKIVAMSLLDRRTIWNYL